MQLGMIGLGRMGANMTQRLLRTGHECVVFDIHPEAVQALTRQAAVGAASLEAFVARLTPPRPGRGQAAVRRPPRAVQHTTGRLARWNRFH